MTRTLSLTSEQAAAVQEESDRILLVAPAGSGKTEVLVRRIERILLDSTGDAFRILAVTYTVKAAEELRGRLRETVADEAWRVDCDTLHGFALQWLMRYGACVGITPEVVVYSDDADRLALLSEYFETLGLGPALRSLSSSFLPSVLHAIDSHRTNRPTASVPEEDLEGVEMSLREAYDAYVGALARVGGIDFPGMLLKLLEALEIDPWIRGNFGGTYRHILVDEGQDLTPAQKEVLRALARSGIAVFVVADDRQSINGFAGGSFENARDLVGPDAKHLELRHNFRCAMRILEAAERIAKSLPGDHPSLVAPGAPPGDLRVREAADPESEAVYVAEWIGELLESGLDGATLVDGEDPSVAPEDIAVIARSRWALDATLAELGRRGRQVSLNVDAAGFLAAPEARLFLNAMAVLSDPADRPARRRFREEWRSLVGAEPDEDILTAFGGSQAEDLVGVGALLSGGVASSTELDRLFVDFAASQCTATWPEDAWKITELWRRYSMDVQLQLRTAKSFLRYVDRQALAKPGDSGIRLLTIHRVKGLEFRAVALVGMQDGVLPDYRARTPRDIDSERRSLYVAMTRSQRALQITWPRVTTDRWGRTHRQQPCRFLAEAGLCQPAT